MVGLLNVKSAMFYEASDLLPLVSEMIKFTTVAGN
jgi:hypothetical protein